MACFSLDEAPPFLYGVRKQLSDDTDSTVTVMAGKSVVTLSQHPNVSTQTGLLFA